MPIKMVKLAGMIHLVHYNLTRRSPVATLDLAAKAMFPTPWVQEETWMRPRIDLNYYGILGVEPSADRALIQKAYRRLAKKYHPDLYPIGSGERVQAESYFKVLNEARDVLLDPPTRAAYDQSRPPDRVNNFVPPYQPPRSAPGPYEPPYGRRRRETSRFTINLSFRDALQMAEEDAAQATEEEEPRFSLDEADLEVEETAGDTDSAGARRPEQADYYWDRGWQYARYGRFDMALECFRQAAYLDPNRKIPLWLHFYRRRQRAREEL